MSNDEIMNVLLTYDNLKELKYENNILTYKNKSVSLENINLSDFFANAYSQMYLDQRTISAKDFYNVMEIHAKKIERELSTKNINELEAYALKYLSNS